MSQALEPLRNPSILGPLASFPGCRRAGAQADRRLDLVMVDGQVAIDQITVVLRIEHRLLRLRPGERGYRIHRVPEREHDELAAVPDIAAQHERGPVARCARVAGHAGGLHVLGVRVAIPAVDGASPDTRDHRRSTPPEGDSISTDDTASSDGRAHIIAYAFHTPTSAVKEPHLEARFRQPPASSSVRGDPFQLNASWEFMPHDRVPSQQWAAG